MKLKLIPNPIPPETHGRNLRSMLPKDDWDLLRTDCYQTANYICEICGGVGPKHPVECHEEWEVIPEKKLQKLVALQAICPDCHLVKHYGRAYLIGKGTKAFKHFCKVNNLTLRQGQIEITDILNSHLNLMGINFKVNIDFAKRRLAEILAVQEDILKVFPVQTVKPKSKKRR